jgi:hypothetical protein
MATANLSNLSPCDSLKSMPKRVQDFLDMGVKTV